jgi:hypothetical protein
MWSYYGRKSKIVQHYPKPVHQTIVEPFAGTAVYSLYHDNWKRQIILVEKDILIIRLWRYLQQAQPKDILALPDVQLGTDIRQFTQLCDEERWLMGFCNSRGTASPRHIVSKWGRIRCLWEDVKPRIASNLYKIRHWEIIAGSYEICPDWTATWFIDPPYTYGGHAYKCSNKDIDYTRLSEWCINRTGQVMVCENDKATWMDFKPLVTMHGSHRPTVECMHYSERV